jgi:rhodanese-related sulfurtransferase
MKKPYKVSLGLFIFILLAGLIFTSVRSNQKYQFAMSAEEMHAKLVKSKQYMNPDEAKEILSTKNDDYIFVDIRNPREYDNFHIEGAVNVPMQRVLDDEFIPYLKNKKKKILYCDESIKANEIKLLLTQFGYDNLYVLQGGASYWKENMLTKNILKSPGNYDDEKLNFDPNKLKASK